MFYFNQKQTKNNAFSKTSLSLALGCASALLFIAPAAPAAVFSWDAQRTQSPNGFTVVPVCIVSGSSTTQNSWFTSPSLDDVILHVRWALKNSWERTSLRFTDWRNCDSLSAAEKAQAVGLYIR